MVKQRLGRGLSALLDELDEAQAVEVIEEGGVHGDGQYSRPVRTLRLSVIERNPDQPRREFKADELEELAQSIAVQGVLQPILVRPLSAASGRYQIVAGERRWRAAQKAGLDEIPVLIRELTDREVLELALVENMQRSDLNPVEEAMAFQSLIDQFNYTQDSLAKAVSKSRSHIANTLRLLALPERVRNLVLKGELTAGHARAIATSEQVEALAEQIISHGLSVRDAERLGRGETFESVVPATIQHGATRPPAGSPTAKPGHLIDLERDLSEGLGLDVQVRDFGKKGGEMRIRFSTIQQLDALVSRLTR
jgi:ParB family transcriptional regulator, chromosome partitioning protein